MYFLGRYDRGNRRLLERGWKRSVDRAVKRLSLNLTARTPEELLFIARWLILRHRTVRAQGVTSYTLTTFERRRALGSVTAYQLGRAYALRAWAVWQGGSEGSRELAQLYIVKALDLQDAVRNENSKFELPFLRLVEEVADAIDDFLLRFAARLPQTSAKRREAALHAH